MIPEWPFTLWRLICRFFFWISSTIARIVCRFGFLWWGFTLEVFVGEVSWFIALMAFWLSVYMLIVLFGPTTEMTVSMAISSALVEDGENCVPALNWARVVLVVSYIIQPILIVVDSQFCVNDPSVYITRLSSLWIFRIIYVSSF